MYMPARAVKTKKSIVVSFRLSQDIYKSLEQYALTQRNHIGHPMSASEAARSLFQAVLTQTISSLEHATRLRQLAHGYMGVSR